MLHFSAAAAGGNMPTEAMRTRRARDERRVVLTDVEATGQLFDARRKSESLDLTLGSNAPGGGGMIFNLCRQGVAVHSFSSAAQPLNQWRLQVVTLLHRTAERNPSNS